MEFLQIGWAGHLGFSFSGPAQLFAAGRGLGTTAVSLVPSPTRRWFGFGTEDGTEHMEKEDKLRKRSLKRRIRDTKRLLARVREREGVRFNVSIVL